MPVQPIIALEQIATIIAFLMILLALMWFVRRNRGGIASRINAHRRMQYIEELPLASQQRVHLIEVDGCTFLVHAGKGHAATFIAVNGEGPSIPDPIAATPVSPRRTTKASGDKKRSAIPNDKPKGAFANAIAQARRNNPLLEFGK